MNLSLICCSLVSSVRIPNLTLSKTSDVTNSNLQPGHWVGAIRVVIKKSRLARTTLLLESSFGTVAEVLALKKVVDWIHFVPLTVDLASPIDAATLLHCHGLAFLSACQATTGDKISPMGPYRCWNTVCGLLWDCWYDVVDHRAWCGKGRIRTAVSERHKARLSGGCTSAA